MFRHLNPLTLIRRSEHRRGVAEARRRSPDRNRARFRLEGLEGRCLLSGISGSAQYPIPSGNAAWYMTTGSDGNLWFTENSAIGTINATSHAVTEFNLPAGSGNARGIAAGPDGNLWFAELNGYNRIGAINPTTHAITVFPLPTVYNSSGARVEYPRDIAKGPDGNLWFTLGGSGYGGIGEINPSTGAISVFPLPVTGPMYRPYAITAGPQGDLWFSGAAGSGVQTALGKIDPTTHAITEFVGPNNGYLGGSWGIAAGSDGNLWYTDSSSGVVGQFNPTSDAFTLFATPGTRPMDIAPGPDGNLWFVEGSDIDSINPTSGVITPFLASSPSMLTSGPDGNLWFTTGGAAIGVATLTSSQFVVTQQPPSSVTAGTPFGLTVTAEDASGSPLTSFNGAVTVAMSSNPGGATLGGTLTATASNGVASFSGLTLTKAASGYTLQVSGGGFGSGVTGAVTVTAGAASHLVITQQTPARVVAGSGFGLQAAIEDIYGNVVTSATNAVNVALATYPAGSTLNGTTTVAASGGVATFTGLTLTKAASGYTIQVSGDGFGGSVTGAFAVTASAASRLLIAQQPSSVVVNAGFTLVVSIVDAYGNMVSSAGNTVTVALANNPTGARLRGTRSVAARNGLATFSGLTLDKVGNGYTLLISCNGLTGTTSSAITVTA